MKIQVLHATILLTDGADKISLKTEFPCPFVSEYLPSQPPLSLDFEATQDTGADYVRNTFNIEPEIVDIRI